MSTVKESLARRTSGPALASAVIGVALGVVAVLGISTFNTAGAPQGEAVSADEALLGGPEYGSRY